MSELVLREDVDGVAYLTLNRPETLNALNPAMFVELRTHVDSIAELTETVGCVVLRGAGRSFSAGNDLKAIQAGETAPHPTYQAETIEALEALPQPVIASVHGHCYTGALELILACDLCVAAEDARFADTHGRWSMTPTWGMSQRLPRRVGMLKAKEMMFTAREVSGSEAAEIGLANQAVPAADLELATEQLARQIVDNSWHTIRGDKRLANGGQEMTLPEALHYERENSPGRGPDMAERLKSFGNQS